MSLDHITDSFMIQCWSLSKSGSYTLNCWERGGGAIEILTGAGVSKNPRPPVTAPRRPAPLESKQQAPPPTWKKKRAAKQKATFQQEWWPALATI